MATGRLQAGVAEHDITVQVGQELVGEFGARVASGQRTALTAKALALSDGDETLALVTLDLFGLQHKDNERLTQQIRERCGLKRSAVMLISSHTRGAPRTVPTLGQNGSPSAYLDDVIDTVANTVVEAKERMQDAALGIGHATLPHLIFNHRLLTRNMKAISAWMGVPDNEVLEPEGPIDPTFSVLVVRDRMGHPLCLLWNFAADNRFSDDDQISAALPYFVQEELDRRLGRRVPCLYLAGCGGNVSYTYELERTTQAVASAIMAVQLETSCDPTVKLDCASEQMILPIRDYSQFWSKADIELKQPQALEACAREVQLLQEEGAYGTPVHVQAFRLGRFGLVGLPGMPFVEAALAIKEGSPFQSNLVIGNTNEYVGYVIPRQAFEHGGFESWPTRASRIGPGGAEFIAERARTLLRRLAKT